jgi:uncharacterized membrane protein YphA (DoxX/SURF4 family)
MSVIASGTSASAPKARAWIYWIATLSAAALFALPGAALLAGVPHFAADMAHLGYPGYFLAILGIWKLLGAAAIVAPRLARLKEWAYAGMIFDAASAAVSRLALGDGVVKIGFPLVIAAIVMLSWALRPRGRRLPFDYVRLRRAGIRLTSPSARPC